MSEPAKPPGILDAIHKLHGKKPAAASELLEKPEAVKRLDAFIAYQKGQVEEALKKLPEEGSSTQAHEVVVSAHYHLDLVVKAEALKRAFAKLEG